MFSQPQQNVRELGVDPGTIVADFGAGSGHYVFALADAVEESGTVYAIDVQQELLTKIKKDAEMNKLKNVKIIWADVEEEKGSTLQSESVDRVVMSNILFQLEDKLGAFREAARILKKGARLLVVDWVDSFGGLGPQPGHVVPPQKARAFAESAGFVFERDIPAGAHHYGMIYKKV